MSFGTGTHASTRLALEALERHIRKGDALLDIGCGSGILAICGLLMGAEYADAVDIDPNAVGISIRNAELNGISGERFRACHGDILTDQALISRFRTGKYQIVLANIIADVIIRLPETAAGALVRGGILISSGIIEPRLDDVTEALRSSGMEIVGTSVSERWACVIAKTR